MDSGNPGREILDVIKTLLNKRARLPEGADQCNGQARTLIERCEGASRNGLKKMKEARQRKKRG